MARKRKKKIKGTERAKPPVIRRIKNRELSSRPKTRRFLKETALRNLAVGVHQIEVNNIKNKNVRPMLSLLSPHKCKDKKARARHEYFSMIASGKGGASGSRRPSRYRFTVKC